MAVNEGDLLKTGTLVEDVDFNRRVSAALIFKAREVIEAGQAASEAFEWSYATAIGRNVDAFTQSATWVVATDVDVLAEGVGLTDATIQGAIDLAWPVLAGMSL